jgi:folate-binding protein YgfZ
MGNPSDWNQVAAASPGPAPAALGDLALELAAARDGAIVSPLAHFSLLRVSGADAMPFLQGQLTCDLQQVTPGKACFGGYCSPQGKLLATFVLIMTPSDYLMLVPGDLAEPLLQRLRKFVLRSRASLELESELRALGVGGPAAAGLLAEAVGPVPENALETVQHPSATLVRLPGPGFLALSAAGGPASLWASLAARVTPAGSAAWDWLHVQAGIPWITAASQDAFLPQMVGLDAIGGVSFEKGCYPGQEIVARTHYRGEVKRRLARGHVDAPARAGDRLLSSSGGEPRGTVLNAAPAPAGGFDLLVVVQVADAGELLRVATPSGPQARFALLAAR